jgi:transglutaminase-like putative cysteine protease
MKLPPYLLGAALLFWGWQAGFLVYGAAMAVVLESAQWIKTRWEFGDQDFRRIWVFCALLLLAVAVYAFTSTGGPADFIGFLQDPSMANHRSAGVASAHAVAIWLRALPMVFFLFIAAQTFNVREGIPPETISLLMQWRWQRARKSGRPLPPAPNVNVSFAYFAVCLFAASFRIRENASYFWGLTALLVWALWSLRSRRFGIVVWAGALAGAIALGYGGQIAAGRLYRLIDSHYPQWFVRGVGGGADPMQSKTALGKIGRLKDSGRIVIRLEPGEGSRPPALLREASYRTYKVGTWYADINRDRYELITEEANHTTWNLLPGKTNSEAVKLACYLPGGKALLPLPAGSGQLENLSAFTLQKSPLGTVFAEGPGLVVFDARYGPGETLDSPGTTNTDLAVSPRETNALNQVVAELQLEPRNRKQALRALAAFFQGSGKFRYTTWQGPGQPYGTNETPVSRFLLKSRAGHCEYFATATVLLLRQLEIPARYAVGYAVHEASGRKYVVRQRDAHAWCLVWNETAKTWQDFDTTPGSWVKEEADRASPLQAFWDFWSRVTFEFSRFRWGQTQLRQYILWALVPILALLLYQIISRSRRRQQNQSREAPVAATAWPGLDSEFYQIERLLAERGAGRQPGEPLSAWLLRATNDPALADLQNRLRELLRLHYRYRFDPHGLRQADRETLGREAKDCLAKLQ